MQEGREALPSNRPETVKIGRSDQITAPRLTNKELDEANPDSSVPPLSDTGSLPVFKYPFSFANKRVYQGGWSREVTIRDLPVAKELAGVNMRLEAGGVRELHWHKAAEWSFMLFGHARLTAIDSQGRSFVRDVSGGDLWYFPPGIPHSIQGLDPDGTEFLLVFDDGHFSEHETVLLSNVAAHFPRDILAKDFQLKPQALEGIFKDELFIFRAPPPGPIEEEQAVAAGTLGRSPCEFSFRPNERNLVINKRAGNVSVVDSGTFKLSATVAVAIVTIHISGKARMTIVGTGNRARTMDFAAGGVG